MISCDTLREEFHCSTVYCKERSTVYRDGSIVQYGYGVQQYYRSRIKCPGFARKTNLNVPANLRSALCGVSKMKKKTKNGACSRGNLEFSGLFDGIPRNEASFYVFSFSFSKWGPRPRVFVFFRGSRTFYSALVIP